MRSPSIFAELRPLVEMCDYGRLYIFDGIMFVERFAGFWASRAERRIRRCYPGGAGRPGIGVAQSSANNPRNQAGIG